MSEKYNVASSLRRNVRLILVKTANRMDNFKGTTSSCDACARWSGDSHTELGS